MTSEKHPHSQKKGLWRETNISDSFPWRLETDLICGPNQSIPEPWCLGAAFPVTEETTITGREQRGPSINANGNYEHPHLLLPVVGDEITQTPALLSGTISNPSAGTDKAKVFPGRAVPLASTALTSAISQPLFTQHRRGLVPGYQLHETTARNFISTFFCTEQLPQ